MDTAWWMVGTVQQDTEWDGLCRREKSLQLKQSHDHTSTGHICCFWLVGTTYPSIRTELLVQAGDGEGPTAPVLFRGLYLQDCSAALSQASLTWEFPMEDTSLSAALPAMCPAQLQG